MNRFYDLKITAKLLTGFILVALIAGAIGFLGVQNLRKIQDADTTLYEHMTVPISTLGSMSVSYQRARVNMREMLMSTNQKDVATYADKMEALWAELEKSDQEFQKTIISKEMKDAFQEYQQAQANYSPLLPKLRSLCGAGRQADALKEMRANIDLAKRLQDSMDKMVDMKIKDAKDTSENNTVTANSAVRSMIVLVVAGMALAIGFGLFISKIISRPINQAAEAADKLAVGDVDVNVESTCKDEIGDMMRAMKGVVENIRSQSTAAQKIAAGDLSVEVKAKSEKDVMAKSMAAVIETLKELVAEATMLSQAAVDGRLQTRGDAKKFEGGYRDIVQGVNDTLDAVINPVNEAAQVLDKVAERDMTARVKGDYKGDLAKIKNSLNMAVSNLDEALQQVAMGADQVASASNQISSGSQALAQGASEQASSLEEISSSLQEMSSMTKQNAGNAKEAKGLSDGARGAAGKGVESMTRLSDAIDRIKASSDETAKIVKTIDEIAFQTNLLALNAAVEAARAGDAGKGFAVVAEEVRNLAMRSAEAAKNTANMIEGAVKNAEDGVAINHEVLANLTEINEQANKVSEVMAEIAAASDQQTQGIEQVNSAVTQMDQVTQSNAANSEESASAAEELSSQAEEMRAMVAGFSLSSVSTSQSTPSVSSAPRVPAPKKRPETVLAGVGAGPAKKNGGAKKENASHLIPFDDDGALNEF